jgi:hypothetical protein
MVVGRRPKAQDKATVTNAVAVFLISKGISFGSAGGMTAFVAGSRTLSTERPGMGSNMSITFLICDSHGGPPKVTVKE